MVPLRKLRIPLLTVELMLTRILAAMAILLLALECDMNFETIAGRSFDLGKIGERRRFSGHILCDR